MPPFPLTGNPASTRWRSDQTSCHQIMHAMRCICWHVAHPCCGDPPLRAPTPTFTLNPPQSNYRHCLPCCADPLVWNRVYPHGGCRQPGCGWIRPCPNVLLELSLLWWLMLVWQLSAMIAYKLLWLPSTGPQVMVQLRILLSWQQITCLWRTNFWSG